jgi:serine protease Do
MLHVRLSFVLFVSVILSNNVQAQCPDIINLPKTENKIAILNTEPTGKAVSLWRNIWVGPRKYHRGVVDVTVSKGSGTGALVFVDLSKKLSGGYLGYVATAQHMLEDIETDSVRVTFRNGRTSKQCYIIASDIEADIAIISTWVPDEYSDDAFKTATTEVMAGDSLEVVALGGLTRITGSELRSFRCKAAITTSAKFVYSDVVIIPGDSGGPLLNERHEIVGVVSGGWFWFSTPEFQQKATWPARFNNLNRLKKLLGSVPNYTNKNSKYDAIID